MPTQEQINEFKAAFNKANTDKGTTDSNTANMELTSGNQTKENNDKLKSYVETKLLAALKVHIHKSHVDDSASSENKEIPGIETLLSEGNTLNTASSPDFEAAFDKFEAARALAVNAMEALSKFTEYKILSGKAHGVIVRIKRQKWDGFASDIGQWESDANTADGEAKQHNYVGATSDIKSALNDIKTWIEKECIDETKDKIAAIRLEDSKLVTYVDSLLSKMDTMQSNAETHFSNSDFTEVILEYLKLNSTINEAEKLVVRRKEFEAQLNKTKDALLLIKTYLTLSPFNTIAFNMRIKGAQGKANITNRRIEDGTDDLKEIESEAKKINTYANDFKTFVAERPKNDEPLNELKTDTNRNQGVVDAIVAKLNEADLAKQISLSIYDAKQIAYGVTLLEQVKGEIVLAKTAFGVSKDLAAVQAVDSTTASTHFQTVKDKFDIAKDHVNKDAVLKTSGNDKELDTFIGKYGDNLSKIKTKLDPGDNQDISGAVTDIKSAATDLDQIFVILSMETGYKTDLISLNTLKSGFNSKKDPIIKKFEEFDGAITAFKKAHESRDWADQFDKFKVANNIAKAVQKAIDSRAKYDEDLKEIAGSEAYDGGRLATYSLATDPKKEVTDILDDAKGFANNIKDVDSLDKFKEANEKLNEAVIKLEENYAKKQLPGSGRVLNGGEVDKIKAAAQKLKDSGNVDALKKLIQDMPDSAGVKVVEELGKILYGFTEFTVEKMSPTSAREYLIKRGYNVSGVPDHDIMEFMDQNLGLDTAEKEAAKTAKKMLEMMGLIPNDVMDNPSMKTIKRIDPLGDPGGYYQPATDLVVMQSRPDFASDQQFAENNTAGGSPRLPLAEITKDGTTTGEIKDEYKAYQPIDKSGFNYFDWATLHEVGHAVDDRIGFMSQRMGQTKFGNWQLHGGDVDTIATKVAEKFKVPDWVAEIKDLLLGKPVTWPTVIPDSLSPKTATSIKVEIEKWYQSASTDEDVWWEQAKCKEIALDGRVYQEAYGSTWVSYPLDERKKGLTGYQFRAPGEWFAELYAAYNTPTGDPDSSTGESNPTGKLNPKHPFAEEWTKYLLKTKKKK